MQLNIKIAKAFTLSVHIQSRFWLSNFLKEVTQIAMQWH